MYQTRVPSSTRSEKSEVRLEINDEGNAVLPTWNLPMWERELQDVTVQEREKGVELVCSCRNLAQPSAKWFHKGRELFSDFHIKLRQAAETATLLIKEIRMRDAGEFKCVMTGENGELETSCVLTIKTAAEMQPPVFVKELQDMEVGEGEKLELDVEVREVEHPEPPDFVTHPMSLTAQEGETVTFACQVKGQPMPSVLWERGGVVIATNNKYKITKIQDQHSLIVYSIDQADTGEYICHLHSTEGDKSHAFKLHVSGDKFIRRPQDVNSRFSHIQNIQVTSQSDGKSQVVLQQSDGKNQVVLQSDKNQAKPENISSSLEKSQRFKHSALNNEDRCIDGEAIYEASFETAALVTSALDISVSQSQSTEPHHHNHTQDRQPVMVDVNLTEGSLQRDVRTQPNLPENMADFLSVLSKNHKRVEDKKSKTVTAVTDFRSVLKHRESSPTHDLGKGTVSRSHYVDFRKVLSHDKQKQEDKKHFETEAVKRDNFNSQHGTLPVTHISGTNISQNGNQTVESYSVLSSSSSSSNNQQNKSQISNPTHKKSGACFSENGSEKDQTAFGETETFKTSLEDSLEYSEMDVQNTSRRGREDLTHSSYISHNFPQNSDTQNSDALTSIKYGRDCLLTDFKQQLVIIGDNELKSGDISEVRCDHKNITHVTIGGTSESYDAKTNDTLFKSEIQIAETKIHRRRDNIGQTLPAEEHQFRVSLTSSPSPSEHQFRVSLTSSPPSSGTHLKSDKFINSITQPHLEAQNPALKSDSVKVASAQPHKASLIHITPTAASLEGLKLEVTSVSVSVPLRSSASSPHSHSQRHSVSVPVNSLASRVQEIKHEDDDEVFSDTAVRRSSVPEQNEFRATSQSFGPVFTWEKAPWDMHKPEQESTQATASLQGELNDTNIAIGNKVPNLGDSVRSDSSLEMKRLDSRSSAVSRARAIFDEGSALSNKVSHTSAFKQDSLGTDFKTMKFRQSVNQTRPGLSRSRAMSASTENVFAEVKLKSASKTVVNSWRKSQLSSSSVEAQTRFRGKDLPEQPQATPHVTSLKIVPPSNLTRTTTTTTTTSTSSSRFSDALRTFQNETKPSQSEKLKNDKSVQNKKIRAVYGKFEKPLSDKLSKFEKPPSGDSTKTKIYSKSKGVGAKFEESIRNVKISSSSDTHSSPASGAKSKLKVTAASKSSNITQKPSDISYKSSDISHKSSDIIQKSSVITDSNSEKVTDMFQHWKAEETASNENIVKKMLGTIGKSYSNNMLLDTPRKSCLDTVKDRDMPKRHSLQMNSAPILTSTSQKNMNKNNDIFDAVTGRHRETSPNLQNDKESPETENLNQLLIDHDRTKLSVNRDKKSQKDLEEAVDQTLQPDISYAEIVQPQWHDVKNVQPNRRELSKPSPKTAQTVQDSEPEWVKGKTLRNIKIRTETGERTVNQAQSGKPEWAKLKPVQNIPESTKNIKKSGQDSGFRNTPKDEQTPEAREGDGLGSSLETKFKFRSNRRQAEDSQKHALDVENNSTSSKKSLLQKPFSNVENKSEFYKPETVISSAAATSAGTIFVAEVASTEVTSTVLPSAAVTAPGTLEKLDLHEHDLVSTAAAKPPGTRRRSATTNDQRNDFQKQGMNVQSACDQDSKILKNESAVSVSNRSAVDRLSSQTPISSESQQSFPESQQSTQSQQSSQRSVTSSWSRPKNLRQIPIYPIHDSEPLSVTEPPKLFMDDSESVLSTASVSSASSDASNMTNDSGYPRNNSKILVDSEVRSLSETQWSASILARTDIFSSDELEGKIETQKPIVPKTRERSSEARQIRNFSEHRLLQRDCDETTQSQTTDVKYTRRFRRSVHDEASMAEAKFEQSPKPVKNETDNAKNDVDEKTSELVQNKSTPIKSMVEGTSKSVDDGSFRSKDSDISANTKENEEVVDLTNDFGTTRKYSKKRRKNIEKDTNNATGNTATDEATFSLAADEATSSLATNDADFCNKEDSKVTMKSEVAQDESDTKWVKATSRPGGRSGGRWNAKETATDFSSEVRAAEPDLNRRSRFRERLNKDNRKVKNDTDNKSMVSCPSDLDLNLSWKNSKTRMKDNEEIPSKVNQEEKNKQTAAALGVETSSAAVTVSSTSVSSSTLSSMSASEEKLCPPSFPMPLRDLTVTYGSKAVLECQVLGTPRPEVKWLLNHKQIEPSKNIQIVYSDVFSQLTIRESFTEHVGDVTCWAKNSLGTVSSHCTLSLEASKKTEGRAFEGPVFTPPKIVALTQNAVSLARGSPLTLTATFMGEPKPSVKWMHNDRELTTDGRVQIVTENSTSCLTITSVVRTDAGKMSICLTSCTGTDQASANICIEDVPGAPVGRPHVYDIGRNSASLSWCGPASTEKNQVTYFIIEAKIRQEKTWDVIVPHCKELSCHILSLRPCTFYQFRVLAANVYGVSAPSEPSESVITSDPYRSPSDYDSEAYTEVFTPSLEFRGQDEFPFEPKEVEVNTTVMFEDVYEVDQEVGKGKFGIVYKCKRKADGTVWAAKIVKCRDRDKSVIRREIDIMNKLRHPKLLLLRDAYESPRQMVLVTEYVGAGELFERVVSEDFVLTERDCIHFLRQICDGVSYMHNLNILHLDLKPENILCMAENSNRIKIIDFGLAQFYQPGQSTKVLFGTPEFIAPEVVNYDEIGFVTDMWSVGVICYVLLSGLSPFLGDSDAETLANVTSGEFDFDDEAFEIISAEAKDFISKLLVMKKEKRMLTQDCLAHVWLRGNETHGRRCRRLNTERLKRFMVRRKWLKTGNAVVAVSRLLKSSNLSGLSATKNGNKLTELSDNSPPPASSLQNKMERNSEDVKVQSECDSRGNYLHQSRDRKMRNFSQDLGETKEDRLFGSDENSTFSEYYDNPIRSNSSTRNHRKPKQDSDTLTDSCDNSIDIRPQTDQNDNPVVNNISQTVVASDADVNRNTKQTASPSAFTGSYPLKKSSAALSAAQSREQIDKDRSELTVRAGRDEAPAFTKSMTNTQACPGDVARFDVVVTGCPLPHVTWFFENEEMHSDPRHTLDCNENTRTFSLIIRGIVEEDEGEYSCRAANSQGEIFCVAELSVLEI